MNGKKKCEKLRAIRKVICEHNDIPFQEEPCTSSGEGCIGTCPKCDQVMRFIEQKLNERRQAGLPIQFNEAAQLYQSLS